MFLYTKKLLTKNINFCILPLVLKFYIMILSAYYDQWYEKSNLIAPESMVRGIAEFLSLAKESLEDHKFDEFVVEHKKEFEGLSLFIFDHQGFYDRCRYYNWQTLQPVVEAVFKSAIKLPHKGRLLELTGNYKLAILALDDNNVANFVLANFSKYAELPDKVEDPHGRAQTLLEAIFAKLQLIKAGKDFLKGSPQWALELILKRYLYDL